MPWKNAPNKRNDSNWNFSIQKVPFCNNCTIQSILIIITVETVTFVWQLNLWVCLFIYYYFNLVNSDDTKLRTKKKNETSIQINKPVIYDKKVIVCDKRHLGSGGTERSFFNVQSGFKQLNVVIFPRELLCKNKNTSISSH